MIQTALIASSLPEQFLATEMPADIELVAITPDLAALLERREHIAVDIVVVELERMGERPALEVEACFDEFSPAGVIVLFDFAPRRLLDDLLDAGARMVQKPVRLPILYQQIRDIYALGTDSSPRRPPAKPTPPQRLHEPREQRPPHRRFRDDQLARLREMEPDLDCECPNHLAALVSGLLAFEHYSRSCESKHPADAAFHRHLGHSTGRARQIVEELLFEVCIEDGLEL